MERETRLAVRGIGGPTGPGFGLQPSDRAGTSSSTRPRPAVHARLSCRAPHAIEALARQFMAQLCHNKRKIAISFSQFTWLHFLAIFRKAPPNSTPYSFRKKEVRPSFWLAPGALTGWTDWLRMVDGVSPSGFGALGLG